MDKQTIARFVEAMAELGFVRQASGGAYRLNGTTVDVGRRWLTIRKATETAPDDSLGSALGKPGLWKTVPSKKGHGLVGEFAIPIVALTTLADEEQDNAGSPPQNLIHDCARWALDTADGKPPAGWSPPPRKKIEAWVPPSSLTVQKGPHLIQGQLVWGDNQSSTDGSRCSTGGRLALRFPVVRIPAGLSPTRRSWLNHVCLQAQQCWRLVRVGVEEAPPDQRAVVEIDLTGAPHAVISESLFSACLSAARFVASWLAEPAALAVDTTVVCHALECCSPSEQSGAKLKRKE